MRTRKYGSCRRTSTSPAKRRRLAFEEPHFYAGQLHDIVVIQTPGLRPDRDAVDLRIIIFLAAIDVHDEVALGAPCDCGHLNPRTPESGECFRQLEFAAGEGAAQDLKLGFWQ